MDSAGKIHYTEFIASCMAEEFIHRTNLVALAFDKIDTDQDGKINKKELQELFEGT